MLAPNDLLEHALLSAWLDAATTGLFALDDTGRVVMLNQAACSLLAVEGTAALNQPLKALMQSVPTDPSLLSWLGTPGFDGERQLARTAKDATVHLLLRASTVRHANGDRFKVVAVSDISALLATQQELEFHRRQWHALNAGVVIASTKQPDMPIVYVNPMFERMSGYKGAEILGRNCRFLQGADTQQPGLAAIRDAIKDQTNGHAVLRNYRKDGSLFMNELFISPVKDASGTLTYFVGIQHARKTTEAHPP
jgi:PAS domain S-box-containing protein